MNHYQTLEFDKIKLQLSDFALSTGAKERALNLVPTLKEAQCKAWLRETTLAKRVIEMRGNPPLPIIQEFYDIVAVVKAGGMLTARELGEVVRFLQSAKRMKSYLAKSGIDEFVSYSGYIVTCEDLVKEVEKAIRGDVVTDEASAELKKIRRHLEQVKEKIKSSIERIAKSNSKYLADSFTTIKGGRFVLPVKKEYRSKIPGTVVETSATGATVFIEPSAATKLAEEKNLLEIQQDNEEIKILYTLTGMVEDELHNIESDINHFQDLDFQFAKGKLSLAMAGEEVSVITERRINIVNGRHPLLSRDLAVPLNFTIGDGINGVVITGSNTGGKTVSIKTIGLLSLMVQSGLHIPAHECSVFTMNNYVLCDIGDGQSINENLSTFSSHIKNIVNILETVTSESLVLLDELGSGTDPSEGTGLVIAILEKLAEKSCLFVATTHYAEVKDYANNTPGVASARMAFDAEKLKPLYILEMGATGKSYALHIAEKLGLTGDVLNRAHEFVYQEPGSYACTKGLKQTGKLKIEKEITTQAPVHKQFDRGDSVTVLPEGEIGIVYQPTDDKGEVGVQLKGEKLTINHKRLKLKVKAEELYPDNYDFSIVFDSVENRKASKVMGKRHDKDAVITHN